jgi:hypothetical protein
VEVVEGENLHLDHGAVLDERRLGRFGCCGDGNPGGGQDQRHQSQESNYTITHEVPPSFLDSGTPALSAGGRFFFAIVVF